MRRINRELRFETVEIAATAKDKEEDDGVDDENRMGPETSDADSDGFDDIPLLGTGLSQRVTLPDAEVRLV